jgi:hypothetical protein
MSNWIHADEARKGRVHAIDKEQQRLIEQLIQLGALRENMFWPDCYVLYTEAGPVDIKKSDLRPCYRPFKECECLNCKAKLNG